MSEGQETTEIRVHGPDQAPTLVYLPGLHGDWTLVSGFRKALGSKVRFAEITYPRTVDWSLEQYAMSIEQTLARTGIKAGWVIAESFGSQVLWSLLARRVFEIQAVIVAGGFARHPLSGIAAALSRIDRRWGYGNARLALWVYAAVAKARFRRSPETINAISEFIARRTVQDYEAAKHRLRLLARNDPRPIARDAGVPIYLLTGFFDPIVPWFATKWLKTNCKTLAGFRVIWRADYNVLGTAPQTSAAQVLQWISTRPTRGLGASIRRGP